MPPQSQPMISSFFQSTPPKNGKRTNFDQDGEVFPSKKPRTMSRQTTKSKPSNGSISKSSHTAVAEDWRFSHKSNQVGPSKQRTELENKRHEAFKKRLLHDNNRLLKKVPEIILDNDISMAVDAEASEEGSGNESDRFKRLSEMFSNKIKGKGKASGKSAAKTKASIDVGPSGEPYTPLEKQILQLKKENIGTVLMVEVGYKYKFYGEDAKVADKALGMVAFMDRNFLVASIPVHRRDVHLKKLLSLGYRVGIVNQIETAALKKISDNRNAPFERKVTNLYTAATFVEELDSIDDMEKFSAPPFMCLIEEPKSGSSADVSIGMITVCPSTGDVVWDDFEDTIMRLELETRLVHTRPSELLVSRDDISEVSKKMLSHFMGTSSSGHQIRSDHFPKVMTYTEAFSKVSEFYTDKRKFGAASESFKSGKLIAELTDFPKRVVIALAHAIKYLSRFGIVDAFLETKFFTKFTTRSHMLLAANTLTNLEIYRNETDGTSRGSLLWVLDRTKTKFGARLLRSWIGRPLVDKVALQERIDAVEEILESSSEILLTLRGLFKGLPDLAKGLCRIQYGQCTPKELAILLPAFNKVALAFGPVEAHDNMGLKSNLLQEIISSLPRLREPLKELLLVVNLKKAAEGKKNLMWNDPEKYPEITNADMCLQVIQMELMEELKAIRKLLKFPSLEWTTVAIDDYLVEVKRNEMPPIPDTWILHSKTKNYARYQPPSVRAKLEERAQHRENLEAESNKAYKSFLVEMSQKYYGVLRDAVNRLATADCLLSLAQVALQENYVKPIFSDDDSLEIIDGRHPVIETISNDPFIPNSITIGGTEPRNKIITGPNMGGKSSSVRMVALIALMAQIGSYVPATSIKMGLLDSILTRMGVEYMAASDDLARGRSTFMVEMSETSEILQTATSKSLVILDELGRGTSTFDGMAIADATLQFLIRKVKCKTLFITHYPLLATKLQSKFPKDVQNLHMGYESDSRIDGSYSLVFLYRLIPGLAKESFGIECARLAGIPEAILSAASERSSRMQEEVLDRTHKNRLKNVAKIIQTCLETSGIMAEAALEDLRALDKFTINPDI